MTGRRTIGIRPQRVRCLAGAANAGVLVEPPHGGVALGADALALQDLDHRHQKDLEVEPERPMVDITDVEREASLPAGGVAAVRRCPTGASGAHLVPACLVGRTVVEVVDEQVTRPDQAHVAP